MTHFVLLHFLSFFYDTLNINIFYKTFDDSFEYKGAILMIIFDEDLQNRELNREFLMTVLNNFF